MTAKDGEKKLQSLFVLGAGFSRPARLPLGNQLFHRVESAARAHGYDAIRQGVDQYIEFQRTCLGKKTDRDCIDLEDFVAYLDVEHRLGFLGKDTWSRDGNASQLMIRKMIAYVISSDQRNANCNDLKLYREFAKRLKPGDYILTFNYDTVLETTFDDLGIDYRLFPDVYTRVRNHSATVGYNSDVILLKMHGSIDWFDKSHYEETKEYCESLNSHLIPISVFNRDDFRPVPITKGPRFASDPLLNIYRIDNLDYYFRVPDYLLETPFILAPSYQKLLYADPLLEFWRGIYNAGICVERLVYIGYSMPQHDNYARQAFHRMTRSFFNSTYGNKQSLKLVDLQPREKIDEFKASYGFVDWDRTDCYFGGFNMEAIKIIFDE